MTINPVLPRGYTAHGLDRLARLVIAADRWRNDMNLTDRYDAIRYGITLHLLTTSQRPTRRDLIKAGLRASNEYVATEMHHHGYDPRHTAAGTGALPGFQRFWQEHGHLPWDERTVERIALAQVWPQLTPGQQEAVTALAETGDHQAAAALLGVPLVTYSSRLRKARLRVLALWHEHETPRPLPRDKRVLARSGTYRGRQLLTEQDLERLRDRRTEGVTLRQLAVETGYSAGALCNLLRGKRRPATTRGEAA